MTKTPAEIASILESHRLYLKGDPAGKRAYLRGADLAGAYLREANLTRANLYGADLREANLRGANLTGANLTRADLREANLTGANLTGADLTRADLREANLTRAYLTGANLTGADLTGAYLTGAYLTGADLREANLTGAKIEGARLPAFQIPQEGSLVVYKKIYAFRDGRIADRRVATLEVPVDARRTATPIGRKCRAEFARVLAVVSLTTGESVSDGASGHDHKTAYVAGEMVYPDSYNDDIRLECTNGVHFFLTYEEAAEY